MAVPESFPEPIQSYDVHIYFDHTDTTSTETARQLRQDIIDQLGHLEGFRVHKLWDKPIGPHPTAMFECDFRSPAIFATVVPWVQIHRRHLPVLVHPRTGNDLEDHTTHAIWIGDKQPLILDAL
ncbi:hypothetical protein BZG36_00100 [Bifiguratus adelaidae]|uniref:DOPA 4,5-dioxygenase n=1 Tax=Bifiguratus adelaidae TaxID=1938954 RepID=A0A261Y8A5_9FUNG|nr:hypothetical protein BZG36_00100 [Bifiguratus adelaidae]